MFKPPVKILGDPEHPAVVFESKSSWMFRVAVTLLSVLLGVSIPAIGIVFWDIRLQRGSP